MERLYKGSRYRIFNFWRCLLLMMNLLCIYLLSHEDTQILSFFYLFKKSSIEVYKITTT